jgi:hypothetical protein
MRAVVVIRVVMVMVVIVIDLLLVFDIQKRKQNTLVNKSTSLKH